MKLRDFYNQIIGIFNKHKVEFLFVGGYAVITHGYIRATIDMDIWINKTVENVKKACIALEELGYAQDKCSQVNSILFEGGMVKVFQENYQ